MDRVQGPTKAVGETISFPFDFTSKLASGETISAQSVSIKVYSGVDASPGSVLGSLSASGAIVTQVLTAGVAGVLYELQCKATTSLSNVYALSTVLAVIPDLP